LIVNDTEDWTGLCINTARERANKKQTSVEATGPTLVARMPQNSAAEPPVKNSADGPQTARLVIWTVAETLLFGQWYQKAV